MKIRVNWLSLAVCLLFALLAFFGWKAFCEYKGITDLATAVFVELGMTLAAVELLRVVFRVTDWLGVTKPL